MALVSDDVLRGIRQLRELEDRFLNGSINPSDVRGLIQAIIEKRYPVVKLDTSWQPPAWWVSPEQQLARARHLWPNAVLPEPPMNFAPRTKTEVLLLHVPGAFDDLWRMVVAPTDYAKDRWEGIKTDKRNLRLTPGKREFTQPVWLAFDPEHGRGACPDSFWGQPSCAASEVLSALIQFPDWCLAWFNGASAPNFSGYRLKQSGNWSHVLYLRRWDDGRLLKLHADWAEAGDVRWASPSVREC